MEQPVLWNIQDISHRVWFLQDRALTAVPRRTNVVPVTVTVITCQHPDTLEKGKGSPIYLGLKEPALCLFCTKIKEQPVLQLQEQDIMALYQRPEPVKPFLFFHNQSGRTSTFESVDFPGWFIAVSSAGDGLVIITQELGKTNTADFVVTAL